jgi:hypothetical protein
MSRITPLFASMLNGRFAGGDTREYVMRPLDPESASVAVAVKISVPVGCDSGMVNGEKVEVHTGLWSFWSVMMMMTDTMLTSLSGVVSPSAATRNA